MGDYPYSAILQCNLGAGCAECGGIGAVRDNTDCDDLAAFVEKRETEAEALYAAPPPPAPASGIIEAIAAQWDGCT
ncbi:hypothetical protein C6Q17_13640 [Burkholderia contaminans]|nr:hypothetical protein C6Q17_13640 [Burkholderia contaminans]